uniref:Uncharacterized protein n=1 Tax=Lymantria dispar multicapsid nuclear polyhedrosis virus TaxID=10449 RepID=A0A1B1MR11_NPVLD|nr:hypothetical protein [Lymantria dispar multiple nucleopolyhedrovirus]
MLAIKRPFGGCSSTPVPPPPPTKKARPTPHYFYTMPQEMYDAVAARLPVRDYVNLVQATGRVSARHPVLFDIANEWTLPEGSYTKTEVFVECINLNTNKCICSLDIDSTMCGQHYEVEYILDVMDDEIHDKYELYFLYIDEISNDDPDDNRLTYQWQMGNDKGNTAHRIAFARACVEHFNKVQRIMDFTFSLYTL